jgi:thioredoxin 1
MPTLMAFRDGVMLFREAGLFEDEAIQTLISKIAAVDMEAIRARLEEQAAVEEADGADASA